MCLSSLLCCWCCMLFHRTSSWAFSSIRRRHLGRQNIGLLGFGLPLPTPTDSKQPRATIDNRDIMTSTEDLLQRQEEPQIRSIRTNADYVAQRLKESREKQEAKEWWKQRKAERNQRIKQILQLNKDCDTAAPSLPPLYAVKVTVCEELRRELKLSGREKRGRVFLEPSASAVQTLQSLKLELHSFFRALRKDTFILQAGFPEIDDQGCVVVADTSEGLRNSPSFWNIECDKDVVKTFAAAAEFFQAHKDHLKRPSIVIHVKRASNAQPLPPPPDYLTNMSDPKKTTSMTMLSFYAFPPSGIENPEEFAKILRKKWKPFDVLGRVYVAQEGVNAQMSVPTNVLDNFKGCCQSIPELGEYMENGINIDPVPLSVEEFAEAGTPAEGGAPAPPFRNLHVRVRGKIVADGLDYGLDWQSAGYDMPPLEWHSALKKAKEKRQQDSGDNNVEQDVPIILDCRNTYETDLGTFELAEPLGTEYFRDSWDALKHRLANTPKDAPIMTYCTGGIRCVKVGAYLTQEMGFTNVSRLAGGIIAYDRTLQLEKRKHATSSVSDEPSMFKGTNFVFDGRLGRSITEDALGVCITCGAETSLVSNCCNSNCHKRMVQCEKCRTAYHGTCSQACRHRLLNGNLMGTNATMTSNQNEEHEPTGPMVFTSLDEYSSGYSTPPPSLYRELEFNTKALIPSGSHMVSGSTQGRFLKQLASMTRDGRILEIGTFTGYGTSCLLEGAAIVADQLRLTRGEKTERGDKSHLEQPGPYVMTMERDRKAYNVAVKHLQIISTCGFNGDAAEALCSVRDHNCNTRPVIEDRLVSITLETSAQQTVNCDLVHVSDALASLEEMSLGLGDLVPAFPFDMVFLDADKTRLMEYANACLTSDLILRKGGMIVVDNVLWKGLVLDASTGGSSELASSSLSDESDEDDLGDIRKNRRARRLANKMHNFNSAIAQDHRAEVLMLPLRDGISVIRKK